MVPRRTCVTRTEAGRGDSVCLSPGRLVFCAGPAPGFLDVTPDARQGALWRTPTRDALDVAGGAINDAVSYVLCACRRLCLTLFSTPCVALGGVAMATTYTTVAVAPHPLVLPHLRARGPRALARHTLYASYSLLREEARIRVVPLPSPFIAEARATAHAGELESLGQSYASMKASSSVDVRTEWRAGVATPRLPARAPASLGPERRRRFGVLRPRFEECKSAHTERAPALREKMDSDDESTAPALPRSSRTRSVPRSTCVDLQRADPLLFSAASSWLRRHGKGKADAVLLLPRRRDAAASRWVLSPAPPVCSGQAQAQRGGAAGAAGSLQPDCEWQRQGQVRCAGTGGLARVPSHEAVGALRCRTWTGPAPWTWRSSTLRSRSWAWP